MPTWTIDHRFGPLQEGVLLGSMIHFRRVFDLLIEACRPKMVCEIGIEGGIVTEFLVTRLSAIGSRYVGIDPYLSDAVADRFSGLPYVTMLKQRSLDALRSIACPDLTIIDGDHNHFTVLNELRLLRSAWEAAGRCQTLILMHDTSWPCARRDFYYDVSAIPVKERKSVASSGGLSIQSPELTAYGFGQSEGFKIGSEIGGSDNGVMTALEDFLAESPDFGVLHVPAVCGLSVLYSEGRLSPPAEQAVQTLRIGLDVFGELLAHLEYNRLLALDLFLLEHYHRIGARNLPLRQKFAGVARKLLRLVSGRCESSLNAVQED